MIECELRPHMTELVLTVDGECDGCQERRLRGIVGRVARVLRLVVIGIQQERQLARHDVACLADDALLSDGVGVCARTKVHTEGTHTDIQGENGH